MKRYLRCSLILVIFLPLFAFAQEPAYPDKGFQLEVGTGILQPYNATSASALPIIAEVNYSFSKIEIGVGYIKPIISLGDNSIERYRTFGPTPHITKMENALGNTSFYYFNIDYKLKPSTQSPFIGGGIGIYQTDALKMYSIDNRDQSSKLLDSYPAVKDLFAFAEVGYFIGKFKSSIAVNFMKLNKSVSYINPYIINNIRSGNFFNIKMSYNLYSSEKKKYKVVEDDPMDEGSQIDGRKYRRIGIEIGIGTTLAVDKSSKRAATAISVEPRYNLNDKFIVAFRYNLGVDPNGIDDKTYEFIPYSSNNFGRYEILLEAMNSGCLLLDYRVFEIEKSRIFAGFGIARFYSFYTPGNWGFTARLTNYFNHFKSGLAFNYAGKAFPKHLALQFGFEIGSGLRKRSKLVYE